MPLHGSEDAILPSVEQGQDDSTCGPPCGHALRDLRSAGYRSRCTRCGSFWDEEYRHARVEYDASYLAARHHTDERVGETKVRALRRWLELAGVSLAGTGAAQLRTCEVGFGGGYCLAWMNGQPVEALGIEASDDHVRRAEELGIPSSRVLRFDRLPERLDRPVDLWLFLDSFEHLPDAAAFSAWVAENSAPEARLLLVAPEAGSASERLLGRSWPHRLVDHAFHWSRKGVTAFLAERGFELERAFRPVKYVALRTAIDHLAHKLALPRLRGLGEGWIPGWAVPFNIGQMGLLFRRRAVRP